MHPLSYLSGSGTQSASVLPLMWFLIIVSVAVCAIITILLVYAVLSRRESIGARGLRDITLENTDGMKWVWTSVIVSAVPLFVAVFWTVAVIAKTGSVPTRAPLSIDITAKRWWWDAAYREATSSSGFRTANEIHIPVGRPVLLQLKSEDVIHSFWVPKLAGKTDVIPGQTNAMWIEAEAPGRYRGQCGEFCGAQHAHMSFFVVADPPQQFEAWRQQQLRAAAVPVNSDAAQGLVLFEQRCGRCHSVRGTRAQAFFGPDLTHLMSRGTIAAGMLQNNPAALSGWVENARAIKPGALMPNQGMSGPELAAMRAYLETLR